MSEPGSSNTKKETPEEPSLVDGKDFLHHLQSANNEAVGTQGAGAKSPPQQEKEEIPDIQALLESAKDPLKSFAPTTRATPTTAPQHHQHSRSVSWGQNNTEYFDDDVSSLGGHQRKLTFEDVVRSGPFVEEAEVNIIRALEKEQSMRDFLRPRAGTDTSTLLDQVPEHRAHDFSNEADGGGHQHRHQHHQHHHPRDNSARKDEDRVPLIQQHRPHRRMMTVEDTLAGLIDNMSAIHSAPHRSDSDESRSEHSHPKESNSAETFAENAVRLEDDQGQRKKRASSRWKVVRDNLPALKEEALKNNSLEMTSTPEYSSQEDLRDSPSDVESQRNTQSEDYGSEPSRNGQDKKTKRTRKSKALVGAQDKFKEDLDVWRSFFRPRKDHIWAYVRAVFFYVMIPFLGVSAALFYIGDNPIHGISEDGSPGDKASISWWLLFCIRQVVTFSMALALQGMIIDFLALGTRVMLRFAGPIVTLLIVQSKGWPFICFWWSILDFAMLSGTGGFARHWCYWQDAIQLFNEKNPSGHIVDSEIYNTILKIVVSVSIVVAVKRFVIGLYLGRQTFTHYGQSLAKVMNKMLLVSEVAGLAKSIEKAKLQEDTTIDVPAESGEQMRGIAFSTTADDDDNTLHASSKTLSTDDKSQDDRIRTELRDPLTGSLRASEKAKLYELLGQWEEPDVAYDSRNTEIATISAVLRFRKAITFIQKRYPFSYAFGPADTREACIDSSQRVYGRLLMSTPNKHILQFETLAHLALKEDGKTIDQKKAKDIVKLFRPDRQGNLTMMDFVKSVDSIYKEFRLLNASIINSSQIDHAFENIINVIFYTVVVTVTLSQMGFNPLALFLSLSSVILAFAFMIGSASAKYFEGLLFIIVRRPYNIGDRIHVSNVETDTSFDGAPGWQIEKVTLFETIARWVPTQELCSLSNGSLANSRIINWARSHQAQFHIWYKIPIDTQYEKIVILQNAIETYLKARPREWISLNGFRANRVATNEGWIEYMIVVLHRDGWQNIGYVLDCKANFLSYIVEVTKQLNMHYKAPPLPVDLRYTKPVAMEETQNGDAEQYGKDTAREEARMQEFHDQALNKYHIMMKY